MLLTATFASLTADTVWFGLGRRQRRRVLKTICRISSVTGVDRAMKNLFLAQRFARQASPITTIIYTHPSDEELAAGVRDLVC